MCYLHLWTRSAENCLLTFTSHAHLYNHLAQLKCIRIYAELDGAYLAALVSFPERVPVANSERCAHFLSAVANSSESVIVSSGRGLVKGIHELCASGFKSEHT